MKAGVQDRTSLLAASLLQNTGSCEKPEWLFWRRGNVSPLPSPAQYSPTGLALHQSMAELASASRRPVPLSTLLLLLNFPTGLNGGNEILCPSEGPEERRNCQWAAKSRVRTTASPSPRSEEQLSGGDQF